MSKQPNVVDAALAQLFATGMEPLYWRRKKVDRATRIPRPGVPWHRGFGLPGRNAVVSACGKMAKRGGTVLTTPVEEGAEWPEPHCRPCETGRAGSDAVFEAVHGYKPKRVGAGFRPRGDPSQWRSPRKG